MLLSHEVPYNPVRGVAAGITPFNVVGGKQFCTAVMDMAASVACGMIHSFGMASTYLSTSCILCAHAKLMEKCVYNTGLFCCESSLFYSKV